MKKLIVLSLIALSLSACVESKNIHKVKYNGKCDKKLNYDIDFDRFDETAQQIAHATGCGIETDLSVTGSVIPNPVKGNLTPREAVTIAIKGTNLKISKQENDLIEVVKN